MHRSPLIGTNGPKWLAGCLLGVLALGGGASAQELVLYRSCSKVKDGTIDFFVRGARPGEQVLLAVEADPHPAPTSVRWSVRADAVGGACFQIPEEWATTASDLPFFVQAFALRERDEMARSNVTLLRREPALFFLVDTGDHLGTGTGTVLRFDPATGRVDRPLRRRVDHDSSIAVAGAFPFVEYARELVRVDADEGPDHPAHVTFAEGEEPIDLAATPDESLLMALTRELLPDGRVLLRLRLFEPEELREAHAPLEVLRGGSRVVSAWLVTDQDSQRVLVAEADGVIREVLLGAEPVRGLTVLPLSPLAQEELLNARVVGDWLVAVTRPALQGGRGTGDSRIVVMDLRHRRRVAEVRVPGAALDFQVRLVEGVQQVVLVMSDGRLELVSLRPTAGTDRSLELDRQRLLLPGIHRLALLPDSDFAFALCVDPATFETTVHRVDLATATSSPVTLGPIGRGAHELGIVGDDRQAWLWLLETIGVPGLARGQADVEDRLWTVAIEPATGLLLDAEATPRRVGGQVKRVVVR